MMELLSVVMIAKGGYAQSLYYVSNASLELRLYVMSAKCATLRPPYEFPFFSNTKLVSRILIFFHLFLHNAILC